MWLLHTGLYDALRSGGPLRPCLLLAVLILGVHMHVPRVLRANLDPSMQLGDLQLRLYRERLPQLLAPMGPRMRLLDYVFVRKGGAPSARRSGRPPSSAGPYASDPSQFPAARGPPGRMDVVAKRSRG